MRWLAAIMVLVFLADAARADEPHVEFSRGLRSRGMPDLAIGYLTRKLETVAAIQRPAIALELANARLDRALMETNENRRGRQFDEARAAFENFLRDEPNNTLAPEAALDLARLAALQGKHWYGLARRSADPAARKDLVARARPMFAEAAGKLEKAIELIDAAIEKLGPDAAQLKPAELAALGQARLRAELEHGINRFNSALAMPDQNANDIRARGAEIAKTKSAFDALAKKDTTSPTCWLARVWAGRCADELDSKTEARKIFEALAEETHPPAAEAARAASLWLLKSAAEDKQAPNRGEQLKTAIAGLESWLKQNSAARGSADWQSAQYFLATLLEETAQSGITRDRNGAPQPLSPTVRQQLQRAERILKEIANAPGDYAERARARRAGVLAALVAERAGGDVTRLVDFEECYLAAQVEAYELSQQRRPAAESARRYARIIAALRRGLALASRSDSPRDVADARAMLAYAYLASGDPYSAAIFGDYLCRSALAGDHGAEIAAYALQAYAGIISLGRERNAGDDEIQADQRRLRDLAQFMETTWPDEPATDLARHQLGSFLLDDKNFAEACAMLHRVAPSYPGIAQARYQLGVAAQRLQAGNGPVPAEHKRQLLKQAIADLEQLPEPNVAGSEESTLATCMAKCQLGNLYLLDVGGDNLRKAAAIGDRLTALVPKLALRDQVRPQILSEAEKLQLVAAYNLALRAAQDNRPEDAEKLLAPAIERIRREASAAKQPADDGRREAQKQVVGMALRLAIQQGLPDAAIRQMALLRQLAGPSEDISDRLLRLVHDLKREADEAKKNGDVQKRDKLERGLVVFLDEIARATKLTDDVRLFLAQAYASIDRHDKSAELLGAIAAPASPTEEATQRHRGIQLMVARERRRAKQFDDARAKLQELLGSWGRNDLNVRREKVLLLEDAGNFGAAVQECREIKRGLLNARNEFERAVRDERAADAAERDATNDAARDKAVQDRATAQIQKTNSQALRDLYWEFDALDTRIVLRSCQKVPDPASRDQKIAAIAAGIQKLEAAFPDVVGKDFRVKYLELFDLEPTLKQKYAEANGKLLLN